MTVAQEEYCRSYREYQRLREELQKSLVRLEEISTDQKNRLDLTGSLPLEKLLLLQDRTHDEALELMRLKNLYFLCSTYEAEGTRRWAALKPEERMGLPGPPE